MTFDMSKYLSLFVSEASEHLEKVAGDLVQLEKGSSAEVIDSMFRHVHSVKGMAASMGFEPVAVLAHRAEDVVHAIRSDPSRLTSDLIDLLLAATDALQGQVRIAAQGGTFDDLSPLIEQLSQR